jgi:hypothetical protein
MGNWTTTKTVELVERICWCGMLHAIPAELSRAADLNKDTSVYCPLGHSWVSNTHEKRESARLRQQIASLEDDVRVAELDKEAERRRHAATKGTLTKTRKRIEAGVCIHCNRTFQNLARHMASKHTESKADAQH